MRSLVIILLCLLIHPLVYAEPELGIALKGGPNAATLAEENRVNRYGFTGGLAGYLKHSIAERVSLAVQTDLLYTPRGAEAIFEGEYLGKSRYHYFDIIISARPAVRFDSIDIYLLLGGSIDLLLSANKENASGVKEDITDILRRIDVALLGGVGIALHLPRRGLGPLRLGTVFLEGRYDYGLIETDSASGGFKNRSMCLMLGLSLALKPRTTVAPPARKDPSAPTAVTTSVE
jgi:hypothetical protein